MVQQLILGCTVSNEKYVRPDSAADPGMDKKAQHKVRWVYIESRMLGHPKRQAIYGPHGHNWYLTYYRYWFSL